MPEYICTMGPSIFSLEKIIELYHLGLRTVRFNMSHLDYDINEMLKKIKIAEKKVGGKISTMLDTCGPEIRLKINESRQVSIGDTIIFDNNILFNVSDKNLEINDMILMDDGKLMFKVVGLTPLTLLSLTDGKIKNGTGVYSEKLSSKLSFLSDKDINDFAFAFENNIDWVACSFVKSAENLEQVLDIKRKYPNCQTKIMAKIETKEAVENIDEIIAISDGIMIARGDLGVSFPIHQITILEEFIADKANKAGVYLTIGTGFLNSMKKNIRPEKSEVSDLYHAFLLANSIMFSSETAISSNPTRVLRMANLIYETLHNYHVIEENNKLKRSKK